MDEFEKRLTDSLGADGFDTKKNDFIIKEIRKMFIKHIKNEGLKCWIRLAIAMAVVIYGALGMKYNTGRYVSWALFTALVGVNLGFMVLLHYWQMHTKLSILKEIKELRLQINSLTENKENNKNQ